MCTIFQTIYKVSNPESKVIHLENSDKLEILKNVLEKHIMLQLYRRKTQIQKNVQIQIITLYKLSKLSLGKI